MTSLICTTPGNLEYKEIPEPVYKKNHSILRVRKIGICGTDLHAFEGTQPYFNYPRILGHELAVSIEETDIDSGFKKDELVTIIPYFNCGTCIACRAGKPNCCATLQVCGVHIDGGMAEFLSVPTYSLVHAEELGPDSLALVEPLSIGAHAVQRAGIQPGENVLVMGAGPIGLGTMEFARIAGGNVIAVDINADRLAFCKNKLKILHTINSSESNVTEKLLAITSGDMPSVVMDATGNLKAIEQGFQYISHGGRYVLVGLQKERINFSHPEFHKREATLMGSRNATRKDFIKVMEAMKAKLIDPTTFITHRVKFGEVAEKFSSWLDPRKGVVKAIVEV
jgi:2-desacetyl-2-hydroxyethyl bacteriochlorophyllide A dehydrogenase